MNRQPSPFRFELVGKWLAALSVGLLAGCATGGLGLESDSVTIRSATAEAAATANFVHVHIVVDYRLASVDDGIIRLGYSVNEYRSDIFDKQQVAKGNGTVELDAEVPRLGKTQIEPTVTLAPNPTPSRSRPLARTEKLLRIKELK
jgi:hypothetical protein